eukprot:gb/GFBE01029469.1/.p1 GENE.gb/GFBE01029469.1/~~gb/GFBE01029469.1/.p1  ORF type:complete len:100 (+),score=34.63 gb/GFBE01029469.1/:1-300(+)
MARSLMAALMALVLASTAAGNHRPGEARLMGGKHMLRQQHGKPQPQGWQKKWALEHEKKIRDKQRRDHEAEMREAGITDELTPEEMRLIAEHQAEKSQR